MNFNQLQCFLAVEKMRSFTGASEIMFQTQSAISKQIKNLETELDAQLFVREGHKVDLTEAGRQFLPYARKIISLCDTTVAEMENYSAHKRKGLSVCLEPGAWAYGIPELIQEFALDNPDKDFTLRERPSESIMEMLENGTSDVVFTWIDDIPEEEYTVIPIIADPVVVIVHPQHRLANLGTVQSKDLIGERIAILARDINMAYYKFLIEKGVQDNVSYDFSRTESLFNIASSGAGIALVLGERASRWKNTDISIVRLEGDPIVYYYSAVFKNKNHNTTIEKLIDHL